MPRKLSQFLAETAKGDVQIGGSSLEFTFYVMWRERFSEDEWTELMSTKTPVREQWKRLLPKVLLSWDLVDDDEHTVPVTAEAIDEHHIPDSLLSAVWRRVIGSELSGKAISNNSSAT
jgi:hypothetical protein